MKHKIPFPLPTIHQNQLKHTIIRRTILWWQHLLILAIKPQLAQYEKICNFFTFFFQISLWKSFCWGFFGNMLYIRFSAAQGLCLDTWPCLFKNNGLNLPGFPNMNQRSWWAFCLPNRLGFHQINLPLVLYRSDKSPQVQSMKD